VLTGNTSKHNRYDGFVFFESAAVDLTVNTSKDNAEAGFNWGGEASGVASNNTSQNNQTDGFEIGRSAALELTGNTSKDNAGAGFAWYDEASGVASNNTSQNNQYKAFNPHQLPGSTTPMLALSATGSDRAGRARDCWTAAGAGIFGGRCWTLVGRAFLERPRSL
jgi:parallel beta-helix repeat protein